MRLQPSQTLRATGGMVCAVDHLAAGVGVAMLRRGGSAVDAAIATSAVLAVTSQHLCGLGGDLFALVVPPDAPPIILNATGRAGSGADPERLRAQGHREMPFFDNIASVTVPGCVDGWVALHARYGRLPFAELLEAAQLYATEGFPASPTLVEYLPQVADLPEAIDYTRTGALRVGTLVRRPGIGRVLADIASGGREAFYEGTFGEELLELGSGEFTKDDLRNPLADWVEPLSIEAFGHRLWSAPPNSQGYLTLASAFIASGLGLPGDPDDGAFAHLLVEAARQAGYDRLDVLAEGADRLALLDRSELERRRLAIDPSSAAELGDHYGEGSTIALMAVDAQRLGVSFIQSNASGFGSRLAVPGLRIFLHNRGNGFSLEPGHPGEYGPGKRPSHTLCPTAVTTVSGQLAGVLGTMGGDSQPQVLLQVLARWLHCGEEPGDALAAGRFMLFDPEDEAGFHTWRRHGNVHVALEGHAPKAWEDGLLGRGHRVTRFAPFIKRFGHAHLISVDGPTLAGATEPRTRGGAVAAL